LSDDSAGHGIVRAEESARKSRREVRDLAAVLALPATWRRLTPELTVSSLVEVIASLLRADFVYAVLVDTLEPLRSSDLYPRGPATAALREDFATALDVEDDADSSRGLEQIRQKMEPLGIRLFTAAPRGQRQWWRVVAGSRRSDFPTATEQFIMEAAADQAAISVEKSLLIAAERRARAEAEAANAAKARFLASMSHELRTPLNAISGYVELLKLGIHGPVTTQQEEDLTRIRRSAQHLLGLINDILNFAKIEAGRIDIRKDHVNLCELLGGLRDSIDPQLRARSLEFDCDLPAAHLAVAGDLERVHQILLNLLSNAMKFTPPGGRISVYSTVDHRSVSVHVRDTGAGIPATKLERIFDPFVQGDQTFARAKDGVGLGLTISRELARAMDGDLTVESTEGKGSTFTVRLPQVGAI
jgi:signal transduction histidine kinase